MECKADMDELRGKIRAAEEGCRAKGERVGVNDTGDTTRAKNGVSDPAAATI
jgi:hypothetical protein